MLDIVTIKMEIYSTCVFTILVIVACFVSDASQQSIPATTQGPNDTQLLDTTKVNTVTSDPPSSSSQQNSLESFASFLDRVDLSEVEESREYQEILDIVKDEGKDILLPKSSFNSSREVTLAFFRLNILSVVRRILARKPASVWMPQPRDVTDTCYTDLMTYFDALVGRSSNESKIDAESSTKDWAMFMFDSTGKPNSGLMVGRLQFVGNYDGCVSTKVRLQSGTHSKRAGFDGRYCRARLPMGQHLDRRLPDNVNTFWLDENHLPININWGICVPDSCSSDHVQAFLTHGTMKVFNLPVEEVTCFVDPDLSTDAGAIFVIILLALFALAVTVCTVLDLYQTGRSNSTSGSSLWWWYDMFSPKSDVTEAPITTASSVSHKQKPAEESTADKKQNCESGDVKNGSLVNVETEPEDMSDQNSTAQEKAVEKPLTNGIPAAAEGEQWQQPNEEKLEGVDINGVEPVVQAPREQQLEGINNEGFELCDLEDGSGTIEKTATGPQNVGVHNLDDGKVSIQANVERNGSNYTTAKHPKMVQFSEDVGHQKKETIWNHVIKGTSLCNNIKHLLNTDVSSLKPTIKCLEGLKAITMSWIVLGHIYTFGGIIDDGNVIFDNSLEMTNIPHRLAFHIVGSAQFGVDTFFVISGCLVMYISLDKLRSARNKGSFWSFFVFHRFWRLTPMYMMVLAVGTTLYKHIVQGPLKAENLEEFDECREKWWSHLLYINNFYAPDKKCMTWTWYLAVDMQFHVISPFLIYPTFRNRRLGVTLLLCLLAFGMFSAFVSELVFGGQFLLMDMNFLDYWSFVYQMPWVRVGAFSIGLLLGMVLRDIDNGNSTWDDVIPRTGVRSLLSPVMWIMSISVGITLALLTHDQWKHGSGHWTNVPLAVWEALSRPLWSLAVAWVVFACNTNRAGRVAKILSWSPFVTLSRLSYGVYLLHPLVIMFVIYSRRTTIYLHPNRIDQVYNYVGHLILTHLFAVVLYLLVETPLRSLEVLWEPRARSKKM